MPDLSFSKVANRDQYIAYDGDEEVAQVVKKGDDNWRVTAGNTNLRFTSATSARTYLVGYFDGQANYTNRAEANRPAAAGAGVDQTLASVGNRAQNLLPNDPNERTGVDHAVDAGFGNTDTSPTGKDAAEQPVDRRGRSRPV